tara:strand:- start:393 stop:512 length:120 start_codon:yes stop_codon:yes gene_type:complete
MVKKIKLNDMCKIMAIYKGIIGTELLDCCSRNLKQKEGK